jgi:hypothetical protein
MDDVGLTPVRSLLEDDRLLGCSAVQSGRSLSAFQRSLLPPSSGMLIMHSLEAVTATMNVRIKMKTSGFKISLEYG